MNYHNHQIQLKKHQMKIKNIDILKYHILANQVIHLVKNSSSSYNNKIQQQILELFIKQQIQQKDIFQQKTI